MITEVAIRNYQALRSVTLKLGRITVITGHTDAGKSALIRAIERACYNDSGYGFLSNDGGTIATVAQVALKTEKGVVIWSRTKTTVTYKVIREGKEMSFTKLGRGHVPDEVKDVLGIRSIRIDAGTGNAGMARIQFSNQFDLPFLVADRGGVAASRVLGRLTGVNVFSQANKRLANEKNQLNGTLSGFVRSRDEKQKELDQYDHLEATEHALSDLKTRVDTMAIKQTRLSALQRLQGYVNANYDARAALGAIDAAAKLLAIDKLTTIFQALWNKMSALTRLSQVKDRVTKLLWVQSQAKAAIEPSEFTRDKITLLFQLKLIQDTLNLNTTKEVAAMDESQDLSESIERFETELYEIEVKFPLCPWKGRFASTKGNYRCKELMKVCEK